MIKKVIAGLSVLFLLSTQIACNKSTVPVAMPPTQVPSVSTSPSPQTSPGVTTPVKPVPEPTTLATPAPVTTTPAAPGQAAFIVNELRMDPEVVLLGDYVIVSVNVSNTGKERGTYTVVLKFNGKTVKTQDVTLDGGASGKVELNLVAEMLGEYKVTVDQLTGRLEVVAQSR